MDHEHEDGYIRDNCLFREEIDIYDKMSAQLKYADNTVLNYSLTTYSPIEGWRVAFNGTEGRIEAWLHIPYQKNETISQKDAHANEMNQLGRDAFDIEPIIVHKLWNEYETLDVISEKPGHGGGDKRLQDKIFITLDVEDEFGRAAGVRDGAMSILIGIAARRSIKKVERLSKQLT